MIRKLVGALLPLFLFGCSSIPSAPPARSPKYQLNLNGTIDGVKFEKIAVGSAATHHNITVESAIAVNYFTVASCHRAVQFTDIIPEDPWYVWDKSNKSFSWTYNQASTIEDNGKCILRFCAFSKVVGSPPVACAIVDFKSSRYQLPSENICNGSDAGPNSSQGTSICHTQVGLIERMRFQGPVVVAPQVVDPAGKIASYWIPNQCVGKFLDESETLWQYQVPENECVVDFMEKVPPYRRAKLTVIPYDTALYPGGN